MVSALSNMAARVASPGELSKLGTLKVNTGGKRTIADRIIANLKDADRYEAAAKTATNDFTKNLMLAHCDAAVQKVKNVLIKAAKMGDATQQSAIKAIQTELFKTDSIVASKHPFDSLKKDGKFVEASILPENPEEKPSTSEEKEGEGIQWGPVAGGIAAGGLTGALGAHYLWSKKPSEDKANDAAKTDDKAAPADAKKADDKASPADSSKTDDKATPPADAAKPDEKTATPDPNNDKKA